MRLILDVEGDGLYNEVTRIHCIVTRDIDTGTVRRFRRHSPVGSGESIEEGLNLLAQADLIVGHNVLDYDLPALAKVYPSFTYRAAVLDTIVCSRLIWTNLKETDITMRRIPPGLWGWHSLEAWGHRLGILKGDFGKTTDWAEWSQAMEDYCVQDVEVTRALYELIVSKQYSQEALDLEHAFKRILIEQERHGFRLDVAAAEKLTAQLQCERLSLTEKLQQVFPPYVETMKTPSYYVACRLGDNPDVCSSSFPTKSAARNAGYRDGEITPGPLRTKSHPFNPASRDQIATRLIERYKWKPKKFTDGGKPAIDESVLAAMPWPEAKLLGDYLMVSKTLGQLAEGDNAVLRLARSGRVHGRVNTNGAVTGRCTHSEPNVAQTPAVTMVKGPEGNKVPMLGLEGGFGWEFRSCYVADLGHVLVGWDASGLELRCLAHYLRRYDGGKFEKLLLEGDVHTANQQAAGFHLRDSAKTFILKSKDDLGVSPRLKLGELRETLYKAILSQD